MVLFLFYYSLDNFKFWTILSFLETKNRKEGILSVYIFYLKDTIVWTILSFGQF